MESDKSNNGAPTDEAARDPGLLINHHLYSDRDYEGKFLFITDSNLIFLSTYKGHRAHTMYVGFPLPSGHRRRAHHRKHKHSKSGQREGNGSMSTDQQESKPSTLMISKFITVLFQTSF